MKSATVNSETARWTFLSNHAYVLLCIARDPGTTLRELTERIGITERAVARIVADLDKAGYLDRVKSGRRNRYEIHRDRPLRHPVVAHRDVKVLLGLIEDPDSIGPSGPE